MAMRWLPRPPTKKISAKCSAEHLGYVRRDLFSDDQNAGYIVDADLLHRLATDRLIELSQAVAAEGC
ncbi:hypothetical protein [Paraburkholderia domus]|uniref:Uncharacterized protein n=1 Tax=Paraburkholderia domus TaxID=2793075 RepID=A0A9N8N776_9BURK|nr:hypothetical protein [Paraburkholderia domus]MBK5169419.1 hypothetical protein [Burkholderia sp. R-70211]CAE6960033.1 hypothetical protein R70211_06880 [Paraburkholderia domus]